MNGHTILFARWYLTFWMWKMSSSSSSSSGVCACIMHSNIILGLSFLFLILIHPVYVTYCAATTKAVSAFSHSVCWWWRALKCIAIHPPINTHKLLTKWIPLNCFANNNNNNNNSSHMKKANVTNQANGNTGLLENNKLNTRMKWIYSQKKPPFYIHEKKQQQQQQQHMYIQAQHIWEVYG